MLKTTHRNTPGGAAPIPENAFARCLPPLLDALGWRGDQSCLHEALPHMAERMDLAGLLNSLANLKFESRSALTALNRIDPRLMPCLFVPRKGAVMVLARRDSDQLLVFNGDDGEYQHLAVDGRAGEAIFFTPLKPEGSSLLKQRPDWFWNALGRFRRVFHHLLGMTLVLSVMALLSPLFIMTIYDQVLGADSGEMLGYLGVGITIYLIGETGFRILRGRLFAFVSVRLGNIVGNEVLRRLFYLPPAYTETADLGSQVARVKDFESVREFFASPALTALFEFPFLLLLLGALAAIAGPVAWAPGAAIGLFAVLGLAVRPWAQRINAEAAKTGSARQAFTVEMLTNFRTIQQAGAAPLWRQRYRELSAEAATGSYRAARFTAFVDTVSQSLVSLGGVATMAVGVGEVLAGNMSLGALMGSMILVWRILAPLRTGFGVLSQIGRIKKSVTQIDRLMNLPLEHKPETTQEIGRRLHGQVTFRNVSLRYAPEAPPALLGVDFKVEPGQLIVIVGHDGAGKSTLLKMIMGLYHPQAGRVLLDGGNLRQWDPLLLRQSIAYAPQKTPFFYGTLAQNMRLAHPTADLEALESAAARAGLLEEIRALPEGFDTRLGDHNINRFSTAFKQQLNLARAFVRPSGLMLFDEPERGLGFIQEGSFIQTLDEARGEKTIFIVTHSPNFYPIADQMLWLEKGRLRMAGPPEKVREPFLQSMGGKREGSQND